MGFFKRNKDKKEAKQEIINKDLNNKNDKVSKETTNQKASVKVDKKPNTKVKQVTKPTTKSAVKTVAKKQPTNIYYLTTRLENNKKVGWEIKRGNATKVSAVVATKEEAKAKVKILAKNSNASVIIYRLDGSIEETYKINN